MSICFGRWELRPDRSGNWSLWQLRAAKDGKSKWQPCERYFQWNTIHNALMYAANEEMMKRNEDEALRFQDYADELRKLIDGYIREVEASLKESQ